MTSHSSRENEFIHIGHIHQTHALNGEVSVSFLESSTLHQLVKKGMFCFVEIINQTFIPYKIRSCSKTGLTAIIGFEGYETIDKAKMISGKRLFFHKEQIPRSYLTDTKEIWIGYQILNADTDTFIGIIQSIIKTPGQILAQIEIEGNEKLIPLNEDLIINTDHDKKAIRMSIPDGLLDI